MEVFKFSIHSIVDVITNSSTVIYTYEDGCEAPAKELIDEMLKLSGESDKKSDDIFYIGTFCDDDQYLDHINESDEDEDEENDELPNVVKVTGEWGTPEYNESVDAQKVWLNKLQLSIIKGEIEKPKWMETAEEGHDYGWRPSTYLTLIPKDEKYAEFGRKISSLLSGIEADGGRDG
jgi:hypothetical protein